MNRRHHLRRCLSLISTCCWVQFTFAPGAGLAAHSAPFPASIYIVRGEGELQLGEEKHPVSAGSFAQMSPKLEHAIRARTELVMLLIINKAARQ